MGYKKGMLVISIQGSFEEAREAIRAAANKGEAIEFRLDLMDKIDLPHISKLKTESKLPVIFTLRKKSHGGKFEGNEREREKKLLELLTLKPDYVDLEYDCGFVCKIDPSIPIISSYHNFEKTPENLVEILKKMDGFSPRIYKIATMARSSLDALRMLVFIKRHQNVAGMCMGEKGSITRILGPVVDSPLTYASLGNKTASGQLSLSELCDIYHFHQLNRETEIYALIGDPVDKSIGHLCHNQIFKKLKKNAVYVKFPLKPIEVPEFFALINHLPFVGFSVTMPLKEEVAPHLTAIDPQAKKIGGINTLIKKGGEWFGMNTDGSGALDALEKRGKVADKTVLIIGAGGAARAIASEATARGARVVIVNRTLRKGEIIAHQVKGGAISIDQIDGCSYDIIINTTAVGMSPKIGEMAIPPEFIREKTVAFDIIMNPKETKFLNTAKNRGGRVVFGFEMFAEQAVRQLKAWSMSPFDEDEILSLIESFSFL